MYRYAPGSRICTWATCSTWPAKNPKRIYAGLVGLWRTGVGASPLMGMRRRGATRRTAVHLSQDAKGSANHVVHVCSRWSRRVKMQLVESTLQQHRRACSRTCRAQQMEGGVFKSSLTLQRVEERVAERVPERVDSRYTLLRRKG